MERPRSPRDGADLPSRHGPAAWFLPSIGLLAVPFALLALLSPGAPARVLAVFYVAIALALILGGLTRFTVHAGGVTRKGLFGERTFRWEEIGTGTATEVEGVEVDWNLLPVWPCWTVACRVHGRDGRVLFRIGLPVERRGRLLFLIRRESRRRAAAAGI